MRCRNRAGEWTPDFRPGGWGGPFIEANAWHYNWSVFQDVQGLINLYGSDEEFIRRLDQVFSTSKNCEGAIAEAYATILSSGLPS